MSKLPAPEKPRPIELRPFDWIVLDGHACLTGDAYENLAHNMAGIARYLDQLNKRDEFFARRNYSYN